MPKRSRKTTGNTDRICALHEELEGLRRRTLDTAYELGELLIAEKQRVVHGSWGAWIKENLPFSAETARCYIRVFSERDYLESVGATDLTEALELLRKKKCPAADPQPSKKRRKDADDPPTAIVELPLGEHCEDFNRLLSKAYELDPSFQPGPVLIAALEAFVEQGVEGES